MAIKFFKSSELETNVKATIHSNGRLGFNSNAQKKLKLESFKFVMIGCDEDNESDELLYLMPTNEADSDGFSLAIAGGYYYANARPLFDKLGTNYEDKKVIYNISEISVDGQTVFKLKKRELERKVEGIEDEE